jgi:adhesin transport system outer membrane protein
VGMNGSSGAGLSLFSQRQSAEADLQAKQASLLAAQQSIEKNLDSMIINVDSIQRRLKSLESAMLTNEAVADSYERQFLAGRKSWLEVMNAAREEVQMLVQIADLRAAYLVSSWRRALYIEGLNAVTPKLTSSSLDMTSQGE